jgi:hypothetical protein
VSITRRARLSTPLKETIFHHASSEQNVGMPCPDGCIMFPH